MRTPKRSFFRTAARDISITFFVYLAVTTFVIQPFRAHGASMVPTISEGDRVFVTGVLFDSDEFERGDVVVFEARGFHAHFIKRVLALPGETVAIDKGTVLVNDERIDEPYVVLQQRTSMAPTVVPPAHLFVLGDNRLASVDSRVLGFLPMQDVVGRALVRYWPVSHAGQF